MVAIAPPSRDDWPATPNGDTVSPTSARFLMTTPSNGARTLVFSIASSMTRMRARAETMAASALLTRAADTCDVASAPVSAAAVVMPSRASARWRSSCRRSSSRVRDDSGRAAFRLRPPRRATRRAARRGRRARCGRSPGRRERGAFLEPERLQPAAGLHADIAAPARDDVAGGHEHRYRRRAAIGWQPPSASRARPRLQARAVGRSTREPEG